MRFVNNVIKDLLLNSIYNILLYIINFNKFDLL